jgi:membrane protein DedA with SNARE-associated domain
VPLGCDRDPDRRASEPQVEGSEHAWSGRHGLIGDHVGRVGRVGRVGARVRVSGPELPGVLGELAPLLDRYGYAALAALITLETLGIPAPGETVLIAAALFAGAGQLNIIAVALIALVAAVVGDNIGYAIGRCGGRALVIRYGRYVLISEHRLNVAERFFTRYGGAIVTVARFVEGLRQLNGVIAGITGMPWRRFLVFNALGAGLWVGFWTSAGYFAGGYFALIYQRTSRYVGIVLVALGVLLVALIVWRLLRRRRSGERDK